MVVARVWRLDAGGRYAHAREAKLDPKRTGDGVTVLGTDDVDQGIRRAGGLSECNGEADDHQDDEELDPAANRTKHRPAPLCLPRAPHHALYRIRASAKNAIASFTGHGTPGTGCFALQSLSSASPARAVVRSEVDSKKKSFAAIHHTIDYPTVRVFTYCHHGQGEALCRPWRLIVATGKVLGFANERLRSNPRSISFDTRRQGGSTPARRTGSPTARRAGAAARLNPRG